MLPIKKRKKRSMAKSDEDKGPNESNIDFQDLHHNPTIQTFTAIEDIRLNKEEIIGLHQPIIDKFGKDPIHLLSRESCIEDVSLVSQISWDLKKLQMQKKSMMDVPVNAEEKVFKQSPIKILNLERPGKNLPNRALSSRGFEEAYQNPYNKEENYAAKEKKKAVDDRCIVYVGNIPNSYSNLHLSNRFSKFGTIKDIQIKSKLRTSLNSPHSHKLDSEKIKFGFITFSSNQEATAAIENGNDKEKVILQLSFGARRQFVGQDYKDLDGIEAKKESSFYGHDSRSSYIPPGQRDFKEVLAEYVNSKNMHCVA